MGWSRFWRRGRWDDERAREIQSYLDIETDENVARGMPPDEARLAARRKLGNSTRIREEIYQMNTIGFVETLVQDLRYGARLLRLNPGFATVAVLSLALGIGANTAIFQLLDAVRLRALPVKDPQELFEVRIAETPHGRTGRFVGRHVQLTYPLWEEIRREQQAFSSMLAWGVGSFNLASGGETRFAQGLWVSGDFFETLGVPALLGRVLTPADDRPGCGSPGAVVSYAFWQREYGGDPSAVGRTVLLDGHPFEIVGVTPARFFGVEVGRSFDAAIPTCSEATIRGEDFGLAKRDVWWLAALGRLKPGWSRAQAEAQLRAISPGVFQATSPPAYAPDDAKNYLAFKLAAFPAASGVSALRTRYETPLWLLLGTAALVLLIACANLANLMLARASAREREIAIRLTLGASRGRVIRQLLAESLLLAALGATLGAWLAQSLSRFLVAFLSTDSDRLFVELGTDWRVLAFTAALAVATCLLFGLAPAVRATRTAPGAVMKAAGRGLTDSRERFSLRRGLVVVQVALSLVLVVGALLFVRSLRNLMTLDAGFRQDGLLVANLDLRRTRVSAERRTATCREVLDRLRALPDVDSAAETIIVPVSGSGWNDNVLTGPRGAAQSKVVANFNRVSAGFFRTIGAPVLQGRDFDDHDTLGAPRVAIVNETFARDVLHEPVPVGGTFEVEQRPGEPGRTYQIVGLVKDMKYTDLREAFTPIAFVPSTQDDDPSPYDSMLIRSNAPLAGLTASVTNAIGQVSPDIAITFQSFKAQVRESLLRERLMATLAGFFGALAALLATIGLYGVMSYMVARRTHEIGIRMALGANRLDMLAMILGEAATLLVAGLVVGVVVALLAARTASALLFGLQPSDPSTYAMASASLGAVAVLASCLPAWNAARLEPTAALREE